MDGLTFAWSIALIVTAGTLPAGVVRTLAYRSGEVDHTPGMRMVATVAMAVGTVGLVCLVALSVALLAR
ncbi:hypothetical protein ACIRN4_02940 [Pimelobacter simplex]|uniref:Uncharacterized protein n=1 Tax=Nocardioides simplex TaxID=2045 RepID=A0A0A1DVA1_NOCSI|nr:hypothetical protein [Pimelobacter simplex]AIY19370.1 hypothetical protein KR76_26050 [Pimelobacter simplex]KAB2812788.1 hypothetical protein F9L07_13725 [Pimelobacter simplex]MCG8149503.1 hypothetical protein [Pimelobacter simplex]SFM18199.1 hypothetical protein SAMN05421671_0120 [Pimelobacter simplex]GEB16127.1 hypothetical protein NSI01_44420 [Pimelobacter simplex]